LTSERTINRLQQIADTAVSAYPSISHNDILSLKICISKDRSVLNEINLTLDSINSKMTNSFEENKKISNLRDWLLPMLMNGQVVVKHNT
jgi:type I restriction enzyme S subunit